MNTRCSIAARSWWALLLCLSFVSVGEEAAKTEPPAPQEDQNTLLERFQGAADRETRSAIAEDLLARGPEAVKALNAVIEQKVTARRQSCIDLLNAQLRPAYIARLVSLTDEQIARIQKTRRLWRHYLLRTTDEKDFQERFLKPCWEVADILLLKVERLENQAIASQRAELLEFGGYLTRCQRALGIDLDPTKGRKSTTGIDYPPLDSPPTFESNLNYLERTLVLANTVAPEGARKVLMRNAEVAQEIDIEEAEFVMFGNEVRMLMGTIAWAVDPVVCACTRDHSNDRKEGKASGHMSTIPGKESFVDRLKRFGTHGSSEGAGGGRNGRGYIHGLSYGGGHTGPLYSLHRNVVGVGRRGNVYTSVYRTDTALKHPCQVTEGELFMPPGLSRADVASSAAAPVHRSMLAGQYGAARDQIARLLARSEVKDERKSVAALALATSAASASLNDRDRMLFRFFDAWITMETDAFLAGLEAIDRTGDVYALKLRVDEVRKAFRGVPDFTGRLAPFEEKLKTKEAAAELRAGLAYYRIAFGKFKPEEQAQMIKAFPQHFRDSIYTKAAETFLANAQEKDPFSFFLEKDESLKQHDYPPRP